MVNSVQVATKGAKETHNLGTDVVVGTHNLGKDVVKSSTQVHAHVSKGNVMKGIAHLHKDAKSGLTKSGGKVLNSTHRTLKTAHGMGSDVVTHTTNLGSDAITGTSAVAKAATTDHKIEVKQKKTKDGSWLGRVVKQGVDGTVQVGKASHRVAKTVVNGTATGTASVVDESQTVAVKEWAKGDPGAAKEAKN